MSDMRLATALGLITLSLQAQWISQPTRGIPRTAEGKANLTAPVPTTSDGKSDLSGLWTLTGITGGLSQLQASEIKPWAEALHQQREENLYSDNPSVQCLPRGLLPPAGLIKIVQTPTLIVMLLEDLEYRQIFLDGRKLPSDPNPAWMGYSVGRWDGGTLVVESTGYNERTQLERGYPHSENLRVTERWHRADFGHLQVELTYNDPAIYDKTWASTLSAVYTPDTDLIEYVCAENEKDHNHLVGKRSDYLKRAVKLAPEVLARYVGSYELPDARELYGTDGPVGIKITLEDGQLKLVISGRQQPLIALSETSFAGTGVDIEFGRNKKGDVTHLVIMGAEGDFRAYRK
jgi:hypothetical protein